MSLSEARGVPRSPSYQLVCDATIACCPLALRPDFSDTSISTPIEEERVPLLGDGTEMCLAKGTADAFSDRSCCRAQLLGFERCTAACVCHRLEILGQLEEVSKTKLQVRGRH